MSITFRRLRFCESGLLRNDGRPDGLGERIVSIYFNNSYDDLGRFFTTVGG